MSCIPHYMMVLVQLCNFDQVLLHCSVSARPTSSYEPGVWCGHPLIGVELICFIVLSNN